MNCLSKPAAISRELARVLLRNLMGLLEEAVFLDRKGWGRNQNCLRPVCVAAIILVSHALWALVQIRQDACHWWG